MLSAEDKTEIRMWMQDNISSCRSRLRTLTTDKVPDAELAAYLVKQAIAKFKIEALVGTETVLNKMAMAVVTQPWCNAAMVVTEMFRFSREDLLDIAFWANRDDGYSASYVQVSQFCRSVIRGNLAALREERVPPVKVKIKRAKK